MGERRSKVVEVRHPLGSRLRIMAGRAVLVADFLAYLLLISQRNLTHVNRRASSVGFGSVGDQFVASRDAAKLNRNAHRPLASERASVSSVLERTGSEGRQFG